MAARSGTNIKPTQLAEYTSSNYSAVDKQIEELAKREKLVTQKIQLENYKIIIKYIVIGLLSLGIFMVLLGVAYRIAFPAVSKIIETVKVVEKMVQPPNIIIQAPVGSFVQDDRSNLNKVDAVEEQQGRAASISGSSAEEAIQETNERLNEVGVNNSGRRLSASLSWNNHNDLDLMLEEPNGGLIFFKRKQSSSEGVLDVDANFGASKTNRPVENISWPGNNAPKGKYNIFAVFYGKDQSVPLEDSTPYKHF